MQEDNECDESRKIMERMKFENRRAEIEYTPEIVNNFSEFKTRCRYVSEVI